MAFAPPVITIDGSESTGNDPGGPAMSDDLRLCVEILEKAIAFEEEGMAFFQERA